MNHQAHQTKKANSKLVITLLLIVFLGPMLFAWGMYKRSDNLAFSYINHGELILPPVPGEQLLFEENELHSISSLAELKGKWSVAYLLPDICSEYCHQNLYNIRQVHIALGKEANRVNRMVWYLPHQDFSLNNFIKEMYPGVSQAVLQSQPFNHYLNPWVDEVERTEMGVFYVIDPLGNVMMAYSGDMPAKSILTDLKRLLKVSQVG